MRTAAKATVLVSGSIVAALLVAGVATATDVVDGRPVAAPDAVAVQHADPGTLAQARTDCATEYGSQGALTESHDGQVTLVIDGAGTGYDPEEEIDAAFCVLERLDVPPSVIARMNHTRAIDGMQDAAWGVYTATWTFHPDNGWDLVITEN